MSATHARPGVGRARLAGVLLALAAPLLLALRSPAQVPAAPAPQAPPAQPSAPATRGQAPTVHAIEVQGTRIYTREQILAALDVSVGDVLDPARSKRLDDSLQVLWRTFKVQTEVKYRMLPGNTVDLLVQVTEQLFDLEPRFVGHKEIDLETLRRWAQLDEKSELYLYQAERVRQRLIEGYKQEGFPFVAIDIQKRGETPGSGEIPDVIFEIREGPQVHVSGWVVHGNRSLPESGALWWKDGLLHLAKPELDGPWLFNLRGSKFVEETLQADLLAMRNVYRDLGWLDAVVELDHLEYTPDRKRVTLHVRVDEGQPYVVSTLAIKGVARDMTGKTDLADAVESDVPLLFDAKELLALCKMKGGERYQRSRQALDATALRTYYGKRGYIAHPTLDALESFVFLEPDLVFDSQRHTVAVTYKLQQGRKIYIREVLLSGSEFTRDRVLRREVDMLPGHQADIEEINRSLNRLYSTNYFNDEFRPLEHRDPTYRFLRVPGDASRYDLEFQVQEGRVVDFNINGGIDSNNGLVGRLMLQMRNFDATNTPSGFWNTFSEVYDKQAFHGAGQTLELDLAPGTLYNQARIRFLEPDLFLTHFDRVSLDVELSTNRRLWRFYDENRDRITVRLGREFGRKLSLFAGVTAQELNITNISKTLSGIQQPDQLYLPQGIFDEAGKSALNGLTLDLNYTDLDNRINPTEGLRVAWRNACFGGPLGGDWEFLRSQIDFDTFFHASPVEEERPQASFHLGLGLGLAQEFGDTQAVPYTERFFLGGLNSCRGFANRGVGPNTAGESNGGQSMLNATLEYRMPLLTQTQPGTYKELEIFRFILFADAGVLDPRPGQLDFSETRASLGFGVGMAYPLPINLFFGFPVESGEGDRRQTFGFSVSAFGF